TLYHARVVTGVRPLRARASLERAGAHGDLGAERIDPVVEGEVDDTCLRGACSLFDPFELGVKDEAKSLSSTIAPSRRSKACSLFVTPARSRPSRAAPRKACAASSSARQDRGVQGGCANLSATGMRQARKRRTKRPSYRAQSCRGKKSSNLASSAR